MHSPGLTYVILLPNGNVKIGYTKHLADRMTKLAYEFNGIVKVLAVLEHGQTMEMLLHDRFAEYRIVELAREQFLDVPEIREFAEDEGIPDHIRAELDDLWNVSY